MWWYVYLFHFGLNHSFDSKQDSWRNLNVLTNMYMTSYLLKYFDSFLNELQLCQLVMDCISY